MTDLTEKTLATERKYTGKIISVDLLDIELLRLRPVSRPRRLGDPLAVYENAHRPDARFLLLQAAQPLGTSPPRLLAAGWAVGIVIQHWFIATDYALCLCLAGVCFAGLAFRHRSALDCGMCGEDCATERK